MIAGPKRVAGRPVSLPAQQATADPLQSYCPDLDQWPGSWAYEPREIPPGLRMVECFKPFLRELPALVMSRKTLRRHRDNIWALGGEGHPPIADGLWPPLAAHRADRPQPHRRRGRTTALPWPVRSRATLLRRDLPQALSLPDKPPKQPRPQRSWFYRSDEPTASLTAAPMQTTWPVR